MTLALLNMNMVVARIVFATNLNLVITASEEKTYLLKYIFDYSFHKIFPKIINKKAVAELGKAQIIIIILFAKLTSYIKNILYTMLSNR